jgi:hypothetical protein
VQYFFEGLTARHGALARGGGKRGKSPNSRETPNPSRRALAETRSRSA